MTTSDTDRKSNYESQREQAKHRAALKGSVTRALSKALYPDNAGIMGHMRRADERGVDGFHYSDEAGEHSFYPHQKENPHRTNGINVTYRATNLWRMGEYRRANEVVKAANYYLAYVLTKAGFTVHVEDHGNHSLTIWADENGWS